MAGYTRQSAASIVNGQIIEDYHFNNEFNQLEAAFSGVTGHAHDGSEGNGPKISLTASVDGVLPVANGGTGVTTLQGLNDALTSGTVFKDGSFVIGDSADTTKRFRFEVSAVSSGTTRTFTLPDADVTISSYMGGLLNTANKADLQAALDIMAASVYDPNGVAGDAFNMDNMVEGSTNLILTAAERSNIAANASARHTHSNKAILDATEQAFTTTLKSKLDGIEAGAQVNAVASVNGKTGSVVLTNVDVGAAASNHSHSNATTSAAGFMSAADKQKLDGVQAGAQVNSVISVAGKTGEVTLSASDISGLGNAATRNVGTTSGTVAAGDDSRIVGAVQKAGDTGLGGFQSTEYDHGNLPSSFTPTLANGNFQRGNKNAAVTINAPEAGAYSMQIAVTNTSGTGGLTAVGFDKVNGQFRSSNGAKHILLINMSAAAKVLTIVEAS